MRWKPGQFAFVSSPDAGMSEPHPFTIASAPRDTGEIRFAIKSLGDWTQRLPTTLRQGMLVVVEGPYGRFDFRKGRKQQLWLAGGIGITPFLAWAESLTSTEPYTIHLVYCVTTPDEGIGLDVLQKAKTRNARFSFEVVVSGRDGRLTAHRLKGGAPFPITDADMFYCGPVGLRTAMERDLAAMGQSPRRFHTELFELR
jgi:predicted ferric reductase